MIKTYDKKETTVQADTEKSTEKYANPIKVTAAGNSTYKAATKTVTVSIKVK